MTGVPPPSGTPPALLQWQLGHGAAPDGTPLVVLVLTHGVLATQVQLSAVDAERFAADVVRVARQARTGLVLPAATSAVRLPANGGRP